MFNFTIIINLLVHYTKGIVFLINVVIKINFFFYFLKNITFSHDTFTLSINFLINVKEGPLFFN